MVLYASIGSGHQKAAEAIASALSSEGKVTDVCLTDVLSLMNPLYRFLIPKAYIWLARYFPAVLGFLYRVSDKPVSLLPPIYAIRSIASRVFSRRFSKFIKEFSPQVIVCTHFLPMELLSSGLIMGEESPLLFVSVTDIIPHAFWLSPGVDRYFVASEESVERLERWGVSREKIIVSGIPVHPLFRRKVLSGASGVHAGKVLNLLVVGGGAGIAPIEKLLDALSDRPLPISITIVTGSNRALFRRLLLKKSFYPFPVFLKGYSRGMHQLMEKTDLVVTKPGGLTTAECLAMGKPMLLFSPIPGQEEENRHVLERWGVARYFKNPMEASLLLRDLISDQKVLFSMAEKAKERGRPNSSSVICEEVLFSLIESRKRAVVKTLAERVFKYGRMALEKWF